MKRIVTVFAILIFAGCLTGPVFAAPDRVPCTISSDFETGELDGFEAYPYAQDIGYEPFTIPQKVPAHNNSKYSHSGNSKLIPSLNILSKQ